MGSEKALVEFRGRPLVVHALGILRGAGLSAAIAGAQPTAQPVLETFASLVPDRKPDLGPLGGVCAAMASTNARWAVLLYGISNIGMAFSFTVMLSRIVHHGLLVHPVPPDVGNRAIRRFGVGTIIYPAATVLGLLWPPLILITMGAVAVYYMAEQTQILPDPG